MAFDLEKIRSLAVRVAASHGLEVVDIEFHGSARHRVLRVFIEKNAQERARLQAFLGSAELKLPENISADQLAGIAVEDCERFSQDFGTLLDVEDSIPGETEYLLEVSSPGLDRKLRGREDFERFTGALAKVQTVEPIRGNRHWQGRISAVGAEELELDCGAVSKRKNKASKTEETLVAIAFSNVAKANLVPEF